MYDTARVLRCLFVFNRDKRPIELSFTNLAIGSFNTHITDNFPKIYLPKFLMNYTYVKPRNSTNNFLNKLNTHFLCKYKSKIRYQIFL